MKKKKKKKIKEKTPLKDLKAEVGERFKKFRLDWDKAQNVLAEELQVHQSTITNIEQGATFPKVNYLHYFREKYELNLNWMISGDGEKYSEGPISKGASRIRSEAPEYGVENLNPYQELNTLMQIPVIEQVIFAKLSECKFFFRDEVKEHLDKLKKRLLDRQKKAERAKVKR